MPEQKERLEDRIKAALSSPNPPWWAYALIAALAGTGGGFFSSSNDAIRTDPMARPDPYTGTMADADFEVRDKRIEDLYKKYDYMSDRCQGMYDRLSRVEALQWSHDSANQMKRGNP